MSPRSVICASLITVFAAAPTSSQELRKLPDLVDRVAPSVVSITVASSGTKGGFRPDVADDSPFQELFQDLAKDPKDAPKGQAPAKETGKDDQSKETNKPRPTTASGMILSPDGFIVTASFVVDKAAGAITVVLADATRLPAKIVGLDERSSIALLKVDSDMPPRRQLACLVRDQRPSLLSARRRMSRHRSRLRRQLSHQRRSKRAKKGKTANAIRPCKILRRLAKMVLAMRPIAYVARTSTNPCSLLRPVPDGCKPEMSRPQSGLSYGSAPNQPASHAESFCQRGDVRT